MSEQNLNDILSGGGLSSLLQNPDVAAKLPKIMEALGPVMAQMREENKEEKREEPQISTEKPQLEKLLAGFKGKNIGSSRRNALLKALEPYMSENRREAMEYIIKVTSLIDILSEVM